MAGASAVQVGTANFTNPRTPLDIIKGIRSFMDKEGIHNLSGLIGVAI
jgi:dihydroorotate dehydrogenase (NAD+) catalytic subunit